MYVVYLQGRLLQQCQALMCFLIVNLLGCFLLILQPPIDFVSKLFNFISLVVISLVSLLNSIVELYIFTRNT